MNNDRELLELAAKAAGIKALCGPDEILRDCTGMHPAQNIYSAPAWNPLTNDGDALRLAVKLVERQGEMLLAWMENRIDFGDSIMRYASEEQGNDPYAATRRAIVRAAAEIGRTM